MRIRLAGHDDLPAILDLLNREIRDGYAHFGTLEQTGAEIRDEFDRARDLHPWLVAESEPGDGPGPAGDGPGSGAFLPTNGAGDASGSGGDGGGAAGRSGARFMGFARTSRWKSREAYDWTVESAIYVHPDHQNHGVARALYARLIPILRAQGYHLLVAGIALPNPGSVRVHEIIGMKRVATFERIGYKHGQWRNVGYWGLTLATDPVAEPKPIRRLDQIDVAALLA